MKKPERSYHETIKHQNQLLRNYLSVICKGFDPDPQGLMHAVLVEDFDYDHVEIEVLWDVYRDDLMIHLTNFYQGCSLALLNGKVYGNGVEAALLESEVAAISTFNELLGMYVRPDSSSH